MPDFHGPIQHVTLAGTLWLIVVFPFSTALFCAWRALSRRPIDARARESVAILSIGAMGLAFAISAYHAVVLATKADSDRFFLQHLWRMVRIGQLDASFDLALDPLASTMTLVITGIGLLIFVFAATYMRDGASPRDSDYVRFFAWLNGFVGAMLLLVLADNFVLLFFGWEGVGLCSWGLIGFYWHDPAKAGAGRKAFLVNRIGDAGFVLGVALLYWGFGGAWTDGDYVPDLNARFASVEVRAPAASESEDGALAPGGRNEGMPGVQEEEEEARAVAPPGKTADARPARGSSRSRATRARSCSWTTREARSVRPPAAITCAPRSPASR